MASILKVDTIQDQAGNNIISENANVITIGASGDTITVPAGATVSGFTSAGIDDNATTTSLTLTNTSATLAGGLTLDIGSANSNPRITFEQDNITGSSFIEVDRNTLAMEFYNNGSERMRIESSGNVGIGTSSPNSQLDITNTTGATALELHRNFSGNVTGGTNSGQLDFTLTDTATSNQVVARINAQGTAGTGDAFGGIMRFFTSASSGTSTERMRIDSSGNVLVGKTSDNFADVGVVLSSSQANAFTRDDGNVVAVRRNTSDGNALLCYKDTTNTGGLIVKGNEIVFFSAHHGHGVRFAEEFVATDGTGNNNDNDIDLGKSGVRWRTVFAGTGMKY